MAIQHASESCSDGHRYAVGDREIALCGRAQTRRCHPHHKGERAQMGRAERERVQALQHGQQDRRRRSRHGAPAHDGARGAGEQQGERRDR